MTLSRRSFLKRSAAATGAVAASGTIMNDVLGAAQSATPLSAGPGNKWPGRVAINFNKGAVTMSGSLPALVPSVIKTMVDETVMLLTGETRVGEAWKAVFPATLTAESTIAIKVPLGCANKLVAPHWSSVQALVEGLKQMEFGEEKFPAANITIYEMRCSDNFKAFGYTAANFPGVKIVRDSNTKGATDGARKKQYARSLTSDFLINVFRPGGHGSQYGGVTLGFKNHYGSYAPDHGTKTAAGYIRDINCTGVVFSKNVLSVCVGICGAKEASGKPSSPAISYYDYASTIDSTITDRNASPTTIIMSTDPVTAEMQTIKMMRLNRKTAGGYGVADMPAYLRASGGVTGALADKTCNIGVIDEQEMEIRRIINGTVIAGGTPVTTSAGFGGVSSLLTVTPVRGAKASFIEFRLPDDRRGSTVTLTVHDISGTLVRSLSARVLGAVTHCSWDNRTSAGMSVAAGIYVLRLVSGDISLSRQFSIMR